ncbi:M23 family metallopeptidase [Lutimaribacter saemankumensis]|uniref:Murein DD-endopeptidase MepM and murein hydrolase activator NlpD, contain LysM domain n=1 Tax=Lutimaribacter saemankumensis TaxID=490829 RepID=A0A1G8GQK4_9RHOB|nr:M23 family metallopeptidase [Lutimaribacter saemankumensis]SDH96637.1 Murein DD-endopeptidase MepM and murein hydrolase activator NlpD, contain LysM domain [Lutimaribacter saemankumensis]
MRTRLAIRTHAFLERWFPEKRLFLRSDNDTRFIRLRPHTQLLAFSGSALLVAWATIATAILLMDSIGAGNFREQAKRDQRMYEERLNVLAEQRDTRANEAHAAQERFNSALQQISVMQSQLLESENRRRELETGIEVIQTTLRRTMRERDAARTELTALKNESADDATGGSVLANAGPTAESTLDMLSMALAQTAAERDQIVADAQDALLQADELSLKLKLMQDQNDQIFRQLEEAMAISVKPLDKMFRAAGMNTDSLINQVRRGYSGQGGPLTPISFSTKGEMPAYGADRANRLLDQMDRLNLYRIAAESAPFAIPVKAGYRFTSGFGYRRDPKTGGRRLHKGVDFAGPVGTPLYATADGVVTHAGWLSGYGRLVKIQHQFGIETRYAHMSRLNVKVGQRVSRGERIGDMGASGRVTGPHLHYEVRVGGKAVNPMIYIKAANDVF